MTNKLGEPAQQQVANSEITPQMLAQEAERKAKMSPGELAWEKTLEANLGNFYLPLYYKDKDAGRETAWDYVKTMSVNEAQFKKDLNVRSLSS